MLEVLHNFKRKNIQNSGSCTLCYFPIYTLMTGEAEVKSDICKYPYPEYLLSVLCCWKVLSITRSISWYTFNSLNRKGWQNWHVISITLGLIYIRERSCYQILITVLWSVDFPFLQIRSTISEHLWQWCKSWQMDVSDVLANVPLLIKNTKELTSLYGKVKSSKRIWVNTIDNRSGPYL